MFIQFNKNLTNVIVVAVLFSSYPISASAQYIASQRNAKTDYSVSSDVSVRASLGVMNGESQEFVYDAPTGRTMSKLIWTFDNTAMFGAGLSVTPTDWVTLSLDGWTRIKKDSSTMDDYDWLVAPYQSWSDWSHHSNTKVDTARMFDLNAEFPFYTNPTYQLSGFLGYKHDYFKWKASDGSYIYDRGTGNQNTGTFNGAVISYEQEFKTPYIGIGAKANFNKFQLNARLIGSKWVDARDKDWHHAKNTTYIENFETGKMLAVGLGASYSFTDNMSVGASYHYQTYKKVKGSTTLIDTSTGDVTNVGGDAAGALHKSHLFSLSLMYQF